MPTEDILNNAVENAAGYGSKPTSNIFTGTFLEKWVKPGDVQQREFGQQVALQQMQNKWNSEGEKLQRMIDAGINPYLAAQGIAGAGGSSSPSVGGVPPTPDGITPKDVIGAVNAATGGMASVADALFKNATRNPTVESLNAGIEKTLAEKGLTDEEIFAWKVDNKYRDENNQVDLRIKALNEKNTAKQWDVLHAQYELMTTQLDTELAKQKELYATASMLGDQAALMQAQKGYYDALEKKTTYEANWANIRVEFWKQHGFDIMSSSTDAILVQKIENGHSIGDIVTALSTYYGSVANVNQQAIEDHAYNIAYESGRAQFDFDWNSPPKGLFDFMTKAVANIKDKLSNISNSFSASSDKDKPYVFDESKLKNSYLEYKAQLNLEYERLNMMRSELADRLARGENQVQTVDIRQEIAKLSDELDKLPKDYKSFKKYVTNQ